MLLCGVDEAGVGPMMGDLVASAVILGEGVDGSRLMDSKRMRRHAARVEARDHIRETCRVGLGRVSHAEIDQLGMARCRRLVFHRALDDMVAHHPGPLPDLIVVDGTLFEPWRGVAYECVVKADATVPAVSAASIVAKCARDESVLALCQEHPEWAERYGWRSNMGYPSAQHRGAILEHGRVAPHRQSFRLREERRE